MIIEKVLDIKSAQIVRMIRNQLKDSMTNDTRWITDEQQIEWFSCMVGTLYLYRNEHTHAPIGYGYLVEKENKVWGTLAVLSEFQNRGYGTEIYKQLINESGTLWIEIFADNTSSLIAAMKSGFQIMHLNDKIVYLKADKNDTAV